MDKTNKILSSGNYAFKLFFHFFAIGSIVLITACSGRTYKDALEFFKMDGSVTSGTGSTGGAITLDTGSDTGHSGTDRVTNDSTPTLSGMGLNPGDTVIIYSDNPTANTELGRAIVGSDGSWTWTLTPGDATYDAAPANQLTTIGSALSDGTHNITYVVQDSSGNQSNGTETLTVTLDTQWCPGPSPCNPAGAATLNDSSNTGVTTDTITSDTTPTINGTGGPGNEYVYVYDNGTLIGSSQIDGTGAWSFTPTTPLGEGTHNLTYYYGDLAGNLSTESTALVVTIDASPPADPTAAINLVNTSDSGISDSDNRTNDDTPELSGSGLTAGEIVIIYADNPAPNTELGRAIVDGSGNWSWTLTSGDTTMAGAPADQLTNVSALPSGTYNLTYVVSDTAGNTSSASPALTLNIDKEGATHSSSNLVGNNYIDITFNEGVYGGDGTSGGALTPGDLALVFAQNGGTATGVTIDSVTTTSAGALTGGETTIRVNFTVTGTASGSETITINAVASSVYDSAGNASSFTTGTQNLLSSGVAVITGTPVYTPVAPVTGGTTGYIEINWSEGVYTNTGSSGAVIPGDFNVAFVQNGGASSGAAITCVTDTSSTSCPGTAPAAGATAMRLQITNTGVTTGTETIQVTVASNQIYSSADNATPTSVNTDVITFPDRVAPTVSNVTSAKANDTYGVGEVIVIQVVMLENVTITGTPQLSLATGTPATTDLSFGSLTGGNTLNFTYNVVSGNESADLDYASTNALTAGTSIRDAAGNDASLTLAAPGAATSLGANKAIVIDAVAPAAPGTPDLLAGSDTGASNTDNITSDDTPTFSVSCENGATVQLFDDGIASGATGSCTGGTVNLTTASLAAGVNVITARQTDGENNVSVFSAGLSVTIDTTAPAAPATAPSLAAADDDGVSDSDGITTVTTGLTFSGTVGAGETVRIYNGGSLLGSTTADGSGNYSLDLDLAAGSYSLTARAVDVAGNESGNSSAVSIEIDTTAPGAPAATADLVAATDSGTSNTDNLTNNNSGIQLTGTGAIANALVRIYSGATEIGQAVADGSGNWSWTMTPGDTTLAGTPANMATLVSSLSDGTNAITYRTEDVAGNLSPASTGTLNVNVDTAVSTHSSSTLIGNTYVDITLNEGVYGGDGSSGGPVTAADLALAFAANGGTATGASIACVTTTASASCPGIAPSGGETNIRVHFTVSGTPDGNETVTISAAADSVFDNAGNASSFTTGGKSLLVLGVASIVGTPTYTPVPPVTGGTTGYIEITWSEGVYTNTGSSGAVVAGDFSVNFTQNSGNSTDAVVSCVTDTLSTSCPGTAPAAGATSMRLQVTNTGVSSGTETIQVSAASNEIYSASNGVTPTTVNTGTISFPDRFAPTVTNVTSSTADGTYKASDTISIQVVMSENVTVTGTPQLTLSTGTPATTAVNFVNVTGGNTLNFTYTVVANNLSTDLDYAATTSLSAGTSIRDAANNDADRTLASPGAANSLGNNKALVIDAVNPSAPGAPDLVAGSDAGTSNTDDITNDDTPSFTVSCETGATVQLYDDGVASGSSGTCAGGTVTLTTGTLASGANSITAIQTDAAGNVSVASTGLSVTIDTTAPTNQDTVYAASSSRTGGGAVTIVSSGTASNEVWFAPSGTTTFSEGATMTKAASGTSTSINAPATAGSYKLYVIDAAGNVSAESSATLTVENTAPVISAVSPATDSYRNNTQVSYTLDEACASGSVTFTRTGGAVDGGSPHVQALAGSELTSGTKTNITLTNNPTLVDGAIYSVAFDCTDAAGNAATTVTSTNVRYDETNPVISGVSPASSAGINNTLVSYTFSEICQSGSITWTRTGGSADGSSPHVQALTGAELNAGTSSNIAITNNPTLVDAAVYNIAWNCTDRAGNTATEVLSIGVTYSDAPLQIVNATTIDRDDDGKIDAYRITFNKNVTDSTFPGYSANSAGSVTSEWLVAGYTNVRLLHGTSVTGYATDTVNDTVIFVGFDESLTTCSVSDQSGCDTGAKPDLTTTASPGLQDFAANPLSQVGTGDVTEADGAEPILIAARSLGATTADAIFSEDVELTEAEDATNYSINNGITVSAASRNASNNKVVNLTTSAQTGGASYTLTVSTDVKDLANFNLNSSANTATFDGLVKPVVASIVTTSATTLRITFNENIVASTAECSNLTTCADIYENISLPVLSAVSVAGAGTNDDQFTLTVNPMIEGQAYTTSVKENTAQSVASSETMGSTNNSATFTGDGRPAANISIDTATVCPTNPGNGINRRAVVQFSESVSTGATTLTNYRITACVNAAEPCATGTGSPNSVGAAFVTDLGGNKYGIDFTDPFDTDASEYQLSVFNVQDDNGNAVNVPTNLTFRCGTDLTAPSLLYANVVSATAGATVVMLTFSETVDSVSANVSSNYRYDATAYGTNVNSAARQSNTAQVQVTFAPGLANGGHQISVRNVQDLSTNAILENGVNNVQPIIVNAPTGFEGGSVFDDPFGDGTPAGMIVKYDGKLYLGADINSTKLFEVDYGLTTAQTITLDADGVAGLPNTSFQNYTTKYTGCNTAFSNPPLVSDQCASQQTVQGVDVLYSACIGGSSTPTMTGSACTGAGGTESMFIGALRTADPSNGFYRSFWATTDKSSDDTVFTYTEGYSGDVGGVAAYRTNNIILFKDQLFVNFGAELGGGGRGGRVCVNASGCSDGLSFQEYVGFPNMNRLMRIGANNTNSIRNGSYNTVSGYSSSAPDEQVFNAINVMYEHDNDGAGGNESQLYIANGGYYTGTLGSARTGTSDGGIVRTVLSRSSKSSLPDNCPNNSTGCTDYYEDLTPDANAKWNAYLSTPYPQNTAVTGSGNCGTSTVEMDCVLPYNIFVPALKAIPAMKTAPNGDLYMIRNACSTTTLNRNGVNGAGGSDFRTERQVCPKGYEIPQLWMMPANCGSAAACTSAWTLVAEWGSSGKTNMAGNTGTCGTAPNICESNSHITLLEIVGDYLYIGFDNADEGSNVWRTDMSSVTSGTAPAESAFSMVNLPGIDNTDDNQRLFSSITVTDAGKDWLIVITRDGTNAMKLYRTANDEN